MINNINYWKKIYQIHNIPFNHFDVLDMIQVYDRRNIIRGDIIIPKKYQNGGIRKMIESEEEFETETFKYKDKEIVIFKTIEDHSIKYSIHKIHKDKDMEEIRYCLLIEIYNDLAHISDIMSTNNCKYEKQKNIKIAGSELLDIAIAFIKSKKKEYNIKKICLRDNSKKYCYYNGQKKFKPMPYLYTLLYGETWYGSRGFRPYDNLAAANSKEIDERFLNDYTTIELNKKYEINKKIWNFVEVNHVPKLKSMIYNSYVKNKNILGSFDIELLLKILSKEKYKEMNLGKFLKYLLDKNYLNCIVLFDIGQELFESIKVPVVDSTDKIIDYAKYKDFYGDFFYLNI